MKQQTSSKLLAGEKGQALIIVVILMLISALIIAPMLSNVGSGLKTGRDVYEERTELFYAADSGFEDGLWQIKNERLNILFTSPAYDPYEYDEDYAYPTPLDVNGKTVAVTINNMWIPDGIGPPDDPVDAREIIEGSVDNPVTLIITGSIPAESTYQIRIFYYYDDAEDPGGAGLEVDEIGIWLPPGFSYGGNCSLYGEVSYSENSDAHCSGQAVIWDFTSTKLVDLPGGIGYPIERSFTFQFSSSGGATPDTALSWINTDMDLGSGITYTWDADSKVYKIISTATDADSGKTTTVEAYTAKSEIRQLGSAIAGDYCAIGNSLMKSSDENDPILQQYRDMLFLGSSATVSSVTAQQIEDAGGVPPGCIPEHAHIDAAYLYWSGWIEEASGVEGIWVDYCDGMANWIPSSAWSAGGGRFVGHSVGGGRYLTMHITDNPPTHDLDLSAYSGQTVEVTWDQSESGRLEDEDRLYFEFSADGGASWPLRIEAFRNDRPESPYTCTIPDEYLTENFRMRFDLDHFDDRGEYCYIDNIRFTMDLGLSPVESAMVNRVIFNGHQITVNPDECQVVPTPDSGALESWSYSCVYDATNLIAQLIAQGESTSGIASNGAGTYTLEHWVDNSGEDEYDLYYANGGYAGTTSYPLSTPAASTAVKYMYTYAGWSLLLIYSSPDTEGHQLYLFPELRYIAPHVIPVKFSISGFLVPNQVEGEDYAAHITCFVGDGDLFWPGDFIALNVPEEYVDGSQVPNSYKLWDGTTTDDNSETNPNNVWNSQSTDLTAASGIDVDTFQVKWASGLLQTGESTAEIRLDNSTGSANAELINLVYIIVSFRSSITSGGTISYLVYY